MPKIIFEINYNIYPDKREDYIKTISQLRTNIRENSDYDYSVYENKKSMNNFSEIYIFGSENEFDAFEDYQNEESIRLTQMLFDDFIKDRKVVYSTKYEV